MAFNLDMLAQNNVIDFDAASYIKGQPPRYIGNPVAPPPFMDYVPQPTYFQQPQADEFNRPQEEDKQPVKNPIWKKLLFGALAIGGLAFAGYKFRSKISNWATTAWNKVKSLKWQTVKDYCVDKAKAVGKFFKNTWNKLFKKSTPPTP